ncbi:site-specific integrase [soil metagenome]
MQHRIDTKERRKRLRIRAEPYWAKIGTGLALGYYKGAEGARWTVRRMVDGRRQILRIGTPDDLKPADGAAVLSYRQALEQALELCGRPAPAPSGYTVEAAIEDYLDEYAARGKAIGKTRNAYDSHIVPGLGALKISALTRERVRRWHRGLAKTRTKSTANRLLGYLKAALNQAYAEGKVSDDSAWRSVKPFVNADGVRRRYLSEAECQRLLNACEPDFRPLVRAALLTGCRYGELIAARVDAYNVDAGTLRIADSKANKARHVPLTDEGTALMDLLTNGRKGSEPLLVRADGEPWRASHQLRRMNEGSVRAGLDPPVTFHALRHTYGSLLALKGVPLQVIAAAMGHADTRMTERHYAHLQPDFIAETIRANLPSFLPVRSNVRRLRR